MKLIIAFCIFIFFMSPTSWGAAKKAKILNKYEFKQLGKYEKEYYLKKLVQIFSNFERMESKKRKYKFSANNFKFNFLSEVYAETYTPEDSCIVGGQYVKKNKSTNRCKISKYKNTCTPKSGSREKGKNYFSCGPIYNFSCAVYEGQDISSACESTFSLDIQGTDNYGVTLDAAKSMYKGICKGDFAEKDGCVYLYKSLKQLNEVAKLIEPKRHANLECVAGKKDKYNECKYCYAAMEKTAKGEAKGRACHKTDELTGRHSLLAQDLKDLIEMNELGISTKPFKDGKPSTLRDEIKKMRDGTYCNEFVSERGRVKKLFEKNKKDFKALDQFVENKGVCRAIRTGDPELINGTTKAQ